MMLFRFRMPVVLGAITCFCLITGCDAAFFAASAGEPELLHAWWGLVTTSLRQTQYERVLDVLKEMDGRFQLEWHDLSAEEAYAGFTQSPYYQQWLDYRAQPKPSPPEE